MYHEFLFALAGASAAGIGIQLLVLNPARRRIATLEARIALADKRADGWFKSYKIAIAQRDEARANAQPRDPKTGRMLPKLKAVA